MSPVQTAIIIIALVTIVGVVISFMRKSSALAGYDEIKAEAPKIAAGMKGEMFRDGEDLVIAGNYKGRPAQVRFSYAENTPGLNIRMQAPVSFTFSSVPKGARATEGRVLLRTGNDMFDAKFASRTDHPTQAKMLVGSRSALQNLEKLCCSQKTYLTMTRGSIELSELVIPTPYTSRHVLDHVESMSVIANAVDGIPGAETVKIVPYAREKSTPVFRFVLMVGAVAAILAVFFIKPTSSQADLSKVAGANVARAEGVDAVDAAVIGDVQGWHAMRSDEYDADVAGNLRAAGIEPNGKFTLDLDGSDKVDVVYTLVSDKDAQQDRVIVLRDGRPVFDANFSNLGGVVPVPKASLQGLEWQAKPRLVPTDSDAFMILTKGHDQLQPAVMMFSDRQIISGIPARWQSISLR